MFDADHVANLDILTAAIQSRNVDPIAMHVEGGKHRRPFGLGYEANMICEEVDCCGQLDDVDDKRKRNDSIDGTV